MKEILHLSTKELHLVLALISVTVGYLGYWFISQSPKLLKKKQSQYTEDEYSTKKIITQRYIGVLFLGIIPAIICFGFLSSNLDFYGLNLKNLRVSALWILGLSALIVPMTILSAKKPANMDMYPQIRAKVWSKGLVAKSALTWIAYLLAYEFLFRGILLFPFVETMGFWPAIVMNCAIYAFAHLPKGITESVGAIPLGLVLCIITLATESILVAFVVHVVMALTNEWRTLYLHKDMKIQ
ncbi:MAG: CPBP family intramembrane metalloprotease [Bacteroidales bacterium]|nr:CPBP family intramembrane metalloprotease [Bacteroidales bacterium]